MKHKRTNTLQGQETFKLLILSYKEYAYWLIHVCTFTLMFHCHIEIENQKAGKRVTQ